jgi:phosphatidylserine/phosphatidylglycerophosphate/cardiolipin synthase-like enzyme
MKLLVQPEDGVSQLVKGIEDARTRVEITIFRFDHRKIETALTNAAKRGVQVCALIARTNSGGEKYLRKLEMRLLDRGITVVRTGNHLIRYHDKLMIVDRAVLYLTGFNFTYLDTAHSRSFGIITKNKKAVQEAVKLFEADARRQPYTAGLRALVVSPENARKQLSTFIRGARKQLLIYDPKISDVPMIHLLQQRARSGVDVRIIGKVSHGHADLDVRKLASLRLHTRTIVRDKQQAFIGSQSLRGVELDGRREAGLIFRDAKSVGHLGKVFEKDWEAATSEVLSSEDANFPADKAARHVVEAVSKELPSLGPVIEGSIKEAVGPKVKVKINIKEVESEVKEAVQAVLNETVKDLVKQ